MKPKGVQIDVLKIKSKEIVLILISQRLMGEYYSETST